MREVRLNGGEWQREILLFFLLKKKSFGLIEQHAGS